MKPYRYPGPQPFSGQQQHIFFGRGKELDELLRLVRREQWLVLYGKSGLGKSSLLNAGLAPRLAKDDGMTPVFIRFHAWTEGRKDTPLGIAADTIGTQDIDGVTLSQSEAVTLSQSEAVTTSHRLTTPAWFQKLAGDDRSLWRFLKERQLGLDDGHWTLDVGLRAEESGEATVETPIPNVPSPQSNVQRLQSSSSLTNSRSCSLSPQRPLRHLPKASPKFFTPTSRNGTALRWNKTPNC
jgi:hypothetical protein